MKKNKALIFVMILLMFFSCIPHDLSYDEAAARLNTLVKRIKYKENYSNRKAIVELDAKQDIIESLPDIGKFPLVVNPTYDSSDTAVEIFSSTEKSGEKTDGWIVEIAEKFNQQNMRTSSGKRALVSIRKIASGTGMEFIASGKYQPDAFTPSNELWMRMIEAYNVKTELIDARLVGNVAGIVMKESLYNELSKKYQEINIKSIVNAIVNGDLAMGYTNPFASSTGMNFIITVLYTFANGNESKMLSEDVISALIAFQKGIPFVAYTTMQMRDSVEKGGSLEAFVLEYQTFYNTASLKTGYKFIPFGVRHDNPLYAVGNLSNEKREVLKLFAQFCKNKNNQKISDNYGFNFVNDYQNYFSNNISGSLVVEAQKLWKTKKDSGKTITAVFLCDVSGSMYGDPINKLKDALIKGSKFINNENSIGLVSFNHEVTKVLPVKKFDINQQASFIATIEDLNAEGKTAMYDGIMVSMQMLVEEKNKNSNIRPMLFVLTDGETNKGLGFESIESIARGLKIPIFTIGYNANLSVLQKVSSINEAASINAETDDVIYKIGSFFNAQM